MPWCLGAVEREGPTPQGPHRRRVVAMTKAFSEGGAARVPADLVGRPDFRGDVPVVPVERVFQCRLRFRRRTGGLIMPAVPPSASSFPRSDAPTPSYP